MVTRRQLLQSIAGASLIAAIPHSIARAGGCLPLHRVVFDSHHAQSARFATEARRRGVETSDTRGDVAALYVRDLMTRWRESAIAVAGLTPHSQLFGLRLLAGRRGCDWCSCRRWRAATPTVRRPYARRRRSNILSAQDHPFTNDALVAWLIAPVPA